MHFHRSCKWLAPAVVVLAALSVIVSICGLNPLAKASPSYQAAQLTATPYKASGIYAIGEKVGWTVSLPQGAASKSGDYTYTVKKNNQDVIKTGSLSFSTGGRVTIEVTLDEPAMIFAKISPHADSASPASGDLALGAAVAPEKLQPSAARP